MTTNQKLIEKLYDSQNENLDLMIYKTVVPYFTAQTSFETKSQPKELFIFEKYENLEPNTKRMFRDLVYEKYNELNCTKKEFLELYSFLDFVLFNKKEFIPLFRRFIYSQRDDRDFINYTAHIHRDCYLLEMSQKNFTNLLRVSPVGSTIETLKSDNDIEGLCYLAILMRENGRNYLDKKIAKELFLYNWEENKHSTSLFYYAQMLQEGEGGPRDRVSAERLYKMNWEENKHSDSLCNYAYCLINCDPVLSKNLHLVNWKENKNQRSLNYYSYWLSQHTSDEKNAEKARELYLYNWTENKNSDALHNYAYFLMEGIGGEKDDKKARELFYLNWTEYQSMQSLECYVYCLEFGIGGPINISEKNALIREYLN